ncbi:Molybdate-binding periplasmic protein precursor [Kluyvera cryocrescens]|uniref:Molybdate-binding periplasmic protein n=1 Tax=Kluyvera cryocrescens TaxID=580 RepID=A0A485CN11_KLUCR|nr:Molybdate-binding periplasmic protein precursor [Kluyvera cryocrescens]
MDYAVEKKAIDTATRETLLGNSLVVVAPKASAQGDITIDAKTNWTSLLKGGRLAVGDPEHVPAGIYAKEALQKTGCVGNAVVKTGTCGRRAWRSGVG